MISFSYPLVISDNNHFIGAVYTNKKGEDIVIKPNSSPRDIISWVHKVAIETNKGSMNDILNQQISLYRRLLVANLKIRPVLNQILTEYKNDIDDLVVKRRSLDRGSDEDIWTEESIARRIEYKKKIEKLIILTSNKTKQKSFITEKDVELAKLFPINSLIDFKNGFTKCIFHDEKTASLKFFHETNSVYCFGCQKAADVITVYRTLNNCSFISAVEKLCQK